MQSNSEPLAGLIRLVDRLEEQATGYLFLDTVHEAGISTLLTADAIDRDVVLVDHRRRFDRVTREFSDVLVCRLNRNHPLVHAALDA